MALNAKNLSRATSKTVYKQDRIFVEIYLGAVKMNNLQILMSKKEIAIDNSILINFHGNYIEELDRYFKWENGGYVFDRHVTYLSKQADISIHISKQIKINILFRDYIYLDENIADAKIIHRFMRKYPVFASGYKATSPVELSFNNSEVVWESFNFIYDAKQASISLSITG